MKPAVRKSGGLLKNADDVVPKSSAGASRAKQVTQYASSAALATAARESAAESLSQAAVSIQKVAERFQRVATMAKEKYDALSPRTKVEIRRFKRQFDTQRRYQQALNDRASEKDLSAQEAKEIEAEADDITAYTDRIHDALLAIPDSPAMTDYEQRFRNYRLQPKRP